MSKPSNWMLFYWWRKEVPKKKTTSKLSDFKTSPQVLPHPPKHLLLDKIHAPIFENKNSTSNYQKYILSITLSNINDISKVPIIINKHSSISLEQNFIVKIQWTENHVKNHLSLHNSKEKDLYYKSNKHKKDHFWKIF